MNRKGQALIEFVLILPIFILILFVIVDFGNIFYSKYELQNQSADIVRLFLDDDTKNNIEDIYSNVSIDVDDFKDKYKKIIISKKIKLMTPLMDSILGNPYLVSVERIVPDEEA